MPLSVILADDHAVMRDGLRLILENQEGIRVVGDAGDGYAAVTLAKEHQPDIALLDVTMPNLNGIEAAHRIREVSPRTRVVILSVHDTSEHIFRALEAGAMGYLLKECAGREVVKAVRELMAGRRYLSQTIAETVLDDYIRRRGSEADSSPLALLSRREREVLQLVVEGKSSKEIAAIIHCSPKTVDTHRSHLMRKLNVSDLPTLIRFAIAHGLIPAP
ncbi:MAG: response regulator transcription factor [Candidatus Hydrogenedentes bacterium]|nr:response regulator transcription factor [Candidatus Hydrogenedentota bacterium]